MSRLLCLASIFAALTIAVFPDSRSAADEPILADFSGSWRSSATKRGGKRREDQIKVDKNGKGYGAFLFDDGAGKFTIVTAQFDLVIKDNAVYCDIDHDGNSTNWKLTLAKNKRSFEMECIGGGVKGLKLNFTRTASSSGL